MSDGIHTPINYLYYWQRTSNMAGDEYKIDNSERVSVE